MNIIVLLCSSGLGKTGGAFFVLKVCLTFVFNDKSMYMAYLRKIYPLILSLLLILLSNTSLVGQTKPIKRLPSLPTNIPPPPSFGGGSQNGKFQIISAEYYSQDIKPFLYKRLIKLNTSTGEAWVLVSKIGKNGETRRWLPLEN